MRIFPYSTHSLKSQTNILWGIKHHILIYDKWKKYQMNVDISGVLYYLFLILVYKNAFFLEFQKIQWNMEFWKTSITIPQENIFSVSFYKIHIFTSVSKMKITIVINGIIITVLIKKSHNNTTLTDEKLKTFFCTLNIIQHIFVHADWLILSDNIKHN